MFFFSLHIVCQESVLCSVDQQNTITFVFFKVVRADSQGLTSRFKTFISEVFCPTESALSDSVAQGSMSY